MRRTKTTDIGLIAGRHPLPVERYLLTGEVDASPHAARETWAQVDEAVQRLVSELEAQGTGEVRLYITGLTRVALLAATLLAREWLATEPLPAEDSGRGGRLVTLVEFDAASGGYVPTLFCAWPGELWLPAMRLEPGDERKDGEL